MRSAIRRYHCRAQLSHPLEQHGDDNRAADEGALPEGVDAEQAQAVADDLDQRRADDGAEGRADAAGEVGAADDRRSNDLQLHAGADIGGDGAQPAGLDDAGDRRRDSAEIM